MPEPPPRLREVLLVEDDAAIGRFVALTLEEDAVRLSTATSLAQARALLAVQRFDVVVCDLMLPDGSGFDLLAELAQAHPGTLRVAFSAALHAPQRKRLATLGMHAVLPKPVAMDALRQAVMSPASPAAPPAPASAADAVQQFFGGDRTLFEAYRHECAAQFGRDLEQGDRCLAQRRWADMRHLAHSLKSVLLMLGDGAGSATARALEASAARNEAARARTLWAALRPHLQALQ